MIPLLKTSTKVSSGDISVFQVTPLFSGDISVFQVTSLFVTTSEGEGVDRVSVDGEEISNFTQLRYCIFLNFTTSVT